MKPLHELINTTEPALPLLRQWADESAVTCEILPPSERRDTVLLGLQVTTRSPLGAVAHDTGGLLIDHGWLRVLGSGHARLTRDLLSWNETRGQGLLLVADDAAGGFFALNGGALGDDAGALYYWAPDSLEWEPLEIGYGDFLQWALSGRLAQFYADLRWPEWQAEVAALPGDQCMSFFPFLWSREGAPATSARKPVPVAEQYAFNLEQGGT
ncbi:hypothetical protein CEG14_10815 [Bordetella genomosp. 1]|uniref:DUF2625 domain-containing protein n=1 Tax=Bordetella genomosp. 1 TaxID=1395607 RepID=A0A261SDS6_9BORD|nr:DUF2625 domain-containing protein [Bordetella genomosp. 1]MDQ8031822.1 DUF2625 domain-containing protein [Bordetella sp.]OZI35559.1 hypothetical protein CEG14_10815 [Bordetella genomosp. 1]